MHLREMEGQGSSEMIATIATLGLGILIGYLGQRSRFCIVSGVRDLYLVKNWHKIKGLFGLLTGATLSFTLFKLIGGSIPNFPMPIKLESTGYMVASIVGGLGIGFFSILAEGCPFRQHVMAAEGRQSALFYLLGFYIGIIYFSLVTIQLLQLILGVLG